MIVSSPSAAPVSFPAASSHRCRRALEHDDHAVKADGASLEALCGHYFGPLDQTAHGIRESRPGEMRIYVSKNVGANRSSGCGQAISAVHSFPEVMVKRKLCSLTIAATRLKPSPSPPLLRLLSER
jgi:hypothetical protein